MKFVHFNVAIAITKDIAMVGDEFHRTSNNNGEGEGAPKTLKGTLDTRKGKSRRSLNTLKMHCSTFNLKYLIENFHGPTTNHPWTCPLYQISLIMIRKVSQQ